MSFSSHTLFLLTLAACTSVPAPLDRDRDRDLTSDDPVTQVSGSIQPEVCEAYVDCQRASGSPVGVLELEFGPNGSCWETAESAAYCEAVCSDSFDALHQGSWEQLHPLCLYGISDYQIIVAAGEICPSLRVPGRVEGDAFAACIATEVLSCGPASTEGVSICLDEHQPVSATYRPGDWDVEVTLVEDCGASDLGLAGLFDWTLSGDGTDTLAIAGGLLVGQESIPCNLDGDTFSCSPDPTMMMVGAFPRPAALVGSLQLPLGPCTLELDYEAFYLP